jgi:predicted Rdx family selenoprotein
MQAPGTPVVTLPTYTPPVFTAATVEYGQTVLTNTVETTEPNTPFTFGQVFKQGQLCPQDTLVGLQMDVKATHPDGSVRHAIISGIAPLVGVNQVKLVRSRAGGFLNTANLDYQCTVSLTTNGIKYSASASNTGIVWLKGSVVQEVISQQPLVADGISHPTMTVVFCKRSYSNGQVLFDITVENTVAYKSITDVVGDINISVDGVTVYEKRAYTHFPQSRFRKTFYTGKKPSVHVKHDVDYLISTKAIPNYDRSVVMTEVTLAGYAAALTKYSFEPMACGRFMSTMATTGGRPDLGLAPDVYAATLLSMDKRAKDLMIASAEVAGSWSSHLRDKDGSVLSVINWPRASVLGSYGDTKNPLTGLYEKLPDITTVSTLRHDASHQPAFSYIPHWRLLPSGRVALLEQP